MTTKSKPKPTKVDPSRLAPDFNKIEGDLEAKPFTFWLGLTADCPRGQIDVAGLHFPRVEEEIRTNDAGQQSRVQESGTINKTVNRHNFDELVRLLPRLVIRMTKVVTEASAGRNTGDPIERSKGYLVKIPDTKAFTDAAGSGRRTLKPYVKRPGDRPATEFMYFMHAPNGKREHEFQTIAVAGLEWPAEIKEPETPVTAGTD